MLDRSFFEMLAKQAYQDGITALSVRAIIEHQGALLILKREAQTNAANLYEFPGGCVDKGETLDQALTREVKEETSLTISAITDFVHSCDYFSYTEGTNKRLFIFAVNVEAVEPIKLTEHSESAWLDKKNRSNYELVPGMEEILSAWWRTGEDYMMY